MLKILETIRKQSSVNVDRARKADLGQFFTPEPVAEFMASMFAKGKHEQISLLDPGAGIGTLSTAFFQEFKKWDGDESKLSVVAYEIDDIVRSRLSDFFSCLSLTSKSKFEVRGYDFVEDAVHLVLFDRKTPYTHAILNPPYRKISSESEYRSLLRLSGIETVNLYSAFVALAVKLLVDGGQLVAIIPRSFCNGPYYRSFRKQLINETSIKRIHLFGARNKAFRDENVLQENVIISLEKSEAQGDVIVSTSTDATFSDLREQAFDFSRIVYPDDPEEVIHVPTSLELDFHHESKLFNQSLADLFVEVSTGPIVDFRVREHTRDLPEEGTVPLLYPGHFVDDKISWPRPNWKKPNAIVVNDETFKWLYPSGFYTVVRRFSSKEEKRRIKANLFDPSSLSTYSHIAFENHFNVFHFRKQGLDKHLANGLAVFLNSSIVDKYFRRMNGHTQVNATDLRRLKYPSVSILKKLGEFAMKRNLTSQEEIDIAIEKLSNQNA